MAKRIYFIAILPPVEIREEVTALKHHFRERYEAGHALKSPPHITLISPYKWEEEEEERKIIDALDDFVKNKAPFEISLSGFGTFPPRVIFINVKKNDHLRLLFDHLLEKLDQHIGIRDLLRNRAGFNPHMTLATRDLKKEHFRHAWSEFRDRPYEAEFTADRLTLLKHNGKFWEIHHESVLGKK